MAIRIFTLFAIVVAAITFIFGACGKILPSACNQSFAYTINAKVYPDKDTVSVGDTIFAEVNFPTTLTDSSSGEIAHLSGASGVATDMGFVKLVSDSPIVLDDAVADFDFILIAGKELKSPMPQRIKLYSFEESSGQFHFKLSIVAKDTGTFQFGLPPAPGVEEKNSNCPTFTLNYLLKNTTDQHYYLWPGGSGVTPQGADYYFYVKP